MFVPFLVTGRCVLAPQLGLSACRASREATECPTSFAVVAVRSWTRPGEPVAMNNSNSTPTALAEAEKRVVKITSTNGDAVVYDGNPASLAGARHETDLCLERLGAFELLVKHNSTRLNNGTIATEDASNIPFVLNLIEDPHVDTYTYKNPCPDTNQRVAAYNAYRTRRGESLFNGIPSVASLPASLLKMAVPMPNEVRIEDHAYALTMLSIWEDREEANRLLIECDRSGRKLRAILDIKEGMARGEDVTLISGMRDEIERKGLTGLELNLESFREFIRRHERAEVKCPPAERRTDDQLRQMVGKLFIKDPSWRKSIVARAY